MQVLEVAALRARLFRNIPTMTPRAMSSVIEPMVIRNNAWLLYLYTPSDDPKLTHGEELYLKYKNDADAFCEIKTIEDTTDHEDKPLVAAASLKSVDMTMEEIRREFNLVLLFRTIY